MARDSKIEWTEHTFNPWWGCTKVSEGCARCYAETFSARVGFSDTGSQFPIWGEKERRRFFGEKHWAEPRQWDAAARKLGVMHRVFCGSMCDILEARPDLVPDLSGGFTIMDLPQVDALSALRQQVFYLADQTDNLLWLFLTKRPENAIGMLPLHWRAKWPRNVMLGVTIENQRRLDERMAYVVEFQKVFPGSLIFASCEPLLSSLDWTKPENRGTGNVNRNAWLEHLDWVIGGGESGAGRRSMQIDWIRKLRDDCENRDDMCRPWPLPFLFKQWGGLHPKDGGRTLDGRTWDGVPRLPYGPQLPEVTRAA